MIDKYCLPNDKNDLEIHLNGRKEALNKLLSEMSEDNIEVSPALLGLIHNNLEEIEELSQ